MPDFELTGALRSGLREEENTARNSQGFTLLTNVRVNESGVVEYKQLEEPFSSGELSTADILTTFPRAQLFKGKNSTLLVGKTNAGANKVWEVDESDWSLTEYTLINIDPTGTQVLDEGEFDDGTPWTAAGTWSVTGGQAVKTAGSSANLTQTSGNQQTALVVGNSYISTYYITVSAGGVSVNLGSGVSDDYKTVTGWYTSVVTVASGDLTYYIKANSAFAGTIDHLSVQLLNVGSSGSETISNGDMWQFAEVGQGWMLFNSTNVVYRLGYNIQQYPEREVPLAVVKRNKLIETGCFGGGDRLFIGGFTATSAWREEWNNFFDGFSDEWPSSIRRDTPIAVNTVAWSTIGSDDIFQFMQGTGPETGIINATAHSSAQPVWLDNLYRNELGWLPMPFQGTVLALKPLGDGVVVYGEDGVALLYPLTEPNPTFGVKRLLTFGIADRGAVAGDESQHVFMSEIGDLWRITVDGAVKRLGYRSSLSPMVGNDIAMSFDEDEGDFYITDNSISFLLSPHGLSELVIEIPISVINADGGRVGMKELRSDPSIGIVSDTFDLGSRKIKTIESIELGVTGVSSGTLGIGIDFIMDHSESFRTSFPYSRSPVFIVPEWGSVDVMISGLEFRFVLLQTDPTNFLLDYIKIQWREAGKRSVKSVLTGEWTT